MQKHHAAISVCVLILGLGTYLFMFRLPAQGSHPPPGECPQPRFTGKAPPDIYPLANPLPGSPQNLKAGAKLYRDSTPIACQECHGAKGDGKGPMAEMFDPPPRNFACKETVNGIPDGQLYWIIKHGSPGTAMPSFNNLSDEQLWQLVLHLRGLAE
jgi:mono/diheme cytochrome c family protein